MAGGAENEGWAVSVGEDGNVEVNRDVTEDRSGSGMLDGRWNFSWDDCRVSDKEDTEICEVMSLVGLVDNTWSEVALSSEEKTWQKGGDAGNVCDSGGAVRKLSKKMWDFGLKGVVGADSDWDEDDWESVWTERRLGKEDGGGALINDDCYKCDDDNGDDERGDNTPCKISVIDLENLIFSFSIR